MQVDARQSLFGKSAVGAGDWTPQAATGTQPSLVPPPPYDQAGAAEREAMEALNMVEKTYAEAVISPRVQSQRVITQDTETAVPHAPLYYDTEDLQTTYLELYRLERRTPGQACETIFKGFGGVFRTLSAEGVRAMSDGQASQGGFLRDSDLFDIIARIDMLAQYAKFQGNNPATPEWWKYGGGLILSRAAAHTNYTPHKFPNILQKVNYSARLCGICGGILSQCQHGCVNVSARHECEICSDLERKTGVPLRIRKHKASMCPIGRDFVNLGATAYCSRVRYQDRGEQHGEPVAPRPDIFNY